jgi:amidase
VLQRVGAVLLSEEPDDTMPSRLLIAQDAFDLAGAAASSALQPALERVAALLGKPEAVTVSNEGLSAWLEVFRVLQGSEVWAQHGSWVQSAKPHLGPGVRQRVQWSSTIADSDAVQARAKRETIIRRMVSLLGTDTVLALPTVPDIAPLRNSDPQATEDLRARALTMLCIAGLARLPQINLPLGKLNGCPIGLSLVGPRDSDMMLLAVAKALA